MSSAAVKIAERNLPELLAVAFRAGGWDAVQGLVDRFGGRRIRIPKGKVGDHHPLAVAAGRAAADAIVESFGNSANVEVPKADHSLRLILINDLRQKNPDISYNELAGILGCTYRHAANLLKEAKSGTVKPRRRAGRPSTPRDPYTIDIEEYLRERR
jgi:hypothetical protein